VDSDIAWMREAISLAKKAGEIGEVPVGAILVVDEKAVSRAHNCTIKHTDPTAHAEMLVLRDAAKILGNYRMVDATLYVTLEPCAMCAGAIVQARLKRVVFGAKDSRGGAVVSGVDVLQNPLLNHRAEFLGGVEENQCSQLLKDFFQSRR
jgi:tRNA(adenine34) deaminase